MRELLLWRLPLARTEPSAYLAQAKLATQTSWGGHLGPSLDPPPVPSPGTGGGKGHQNGAEETFTWWTQVLAFSPLLPRGSEWKPLWYGQVWNPPRAHENQVTGKYYLYVSTHTWGSQPWAHTQHQHLDSVHQAPYPHPPSTNMLVSQQKTYLQKLVRCVYIWETNLSLEETSHLNKRAQSHKEKPYWWSWKVPYAGRFNIILEAQPGKRLRACNSPASLQTSLTPAHPRLPFRVPSTLPATVPMPSPSANGCW